jgi:hypothetical protein
MAKDSLTSKSKKARRFAYLDEMHLGGIERRVAAGEYVDAAELAEALRKHGSRPIPSAVLDYLCRCLEGKIGKPRGRTPKPIAEQNRRQMLIRYSYRRYYAWLKERKKRYGRLDGWPLIRAASWWQGPPHERAARMAAHRWFHGDDSWRSVNNRVSSQK